MVALTMARSGGQTDWRGAHLPSGTPIGPSVLGPRPGEEPISPTNGGCMNCGDKLGVRTYLLTDRFGIPAGRWLLCHPCWQWGQGLEPPLNPDPLYVGEEYR